MDSSSTNQKRFDVAIVGGGFSGTALAIQLLRREAGLSVAMIDPAGDAGRGVAYSTKHVCHLLNVACGGMSALPEEPDHFLRWACANHSIATEDSTFVPRKVYGQYVGELMEETLAHCGEESFQRYAYEAVGLNATQPGWAVGLKSASEVRARTVVLATGNYAPANLKIPGLEESCKRYMASAWSKQALENIPAKGSVLLIGAGLTSVDVAVALKSEDFRGQIHMLSRHGLMPQTHRPAAEWEPFWDEGSPRTALGLLRLVRDEVRRAETAGGDWRGVVDALRPSNQEIWQSLPADEQKRFLRHIRPYWDVHRHPIAPEIGAAVGELLREGKMHLHAGRVTQYRENENGAVVEFRKRRTGALETLRIDRVINCTGPETDPRRVKAPLIANLLQQGLARPDHLFLGLDVDGDGALRDAKGASSAALFARDRREKGACGRALRFPSFACRRRG